MGTQWEQLILLRLLLTHPIVFQPLFSRLVPLHEKQWHCRQQDTYILEQQYLWEYCPIVLFPTISMVQVAYCCYQGYVIPISDTIIVYGCPLFAHPELPAYGGLSWCPTWSSTTAYKFVISFNNPQYVDGHTSSPPTSESLTRIGPL